MSGQRGISGKARALLLGSTGGMALAMAADCGAAWAQADQASSKPAAAEEVVVTGSRVARSTFVTPNPVTVMNAQEIQKLGITNVGDVVALMPQNSNFFAANNVGLGNFNVGAQLANLRGLNPFFGTRTLTLIDSRRVVPTTTGGGVDITLIPSILVGRSETFTGGASAVYGSDAVAGVVNIILDTSFTGVKAQADYGQTSAGDGADYHAAAAFGTKFGNGRGHFVIGGEYEHNDAIGICSQVRDWCATNEAMFTNTGYASNGQPHYIIGPNGTSANTSLTGVLSPCSIYAGACVNLGSGAPFFTNPQIQFSQDGASLIPYAVGQYSDGAGFFGFRQGGDNLAAGAYDTTTMRPQVTRYTSLAHATYELTDSIKAFIEGSFARSEAVNPVANGAIGPYALQVGPAVWVGFHIPQDNAFLTPAEAAYIGPNGAEFGRNMLNVQTARNETNNTTWRIVGGINGELPGNWGWDVYGEYGKNSNDQHLYHNVVSTFLTYALDAARDPGTGNTVCGVNIPGRISPATGAPYTATDVAKAAQGGTCVPLNLFGVGHASQAAVDYAFRTLQETSTYDQLVLSGNIHGDLYQGWGAGAIKLAAGGEYRREHGSVQHDLANQPWYTDYTLSYGLDYAGTIEVVEGYAELDVPIAKDLPLIHFLDVDGAIRETRNKNSEDVGPQAGSSKTQYITNWKLSGAWDLTNWLRLRATRSRDARAAQFRELFQSYATTAGGPFGTVNPNPWTGLPDPANITTGGDVNLKPEAADTTTVGMVISPKSGPFQGLQLSADWYQIYLNDAIVGPPFGLGVANIVGQCFQGVQAFCARMTRDPVTNDILTVNNTAVNIGRFTTRGVDFEADYNLPLERLGGNAPGNLNFRVIASYLYDMIIDAGLGAPPVNFAGQSGPTAAFGGFNTSPKWQANAFVTYSNGPFSGTVSFRYIGPGRFETLDGTGNLVLGPGDPGYSTSYIGSINNNKVDSALYMNLASSYKLPFWGNGDRSMEIFGSVNNVFDKSPAVAPGGNGYPTNPVYFDTYGRTWKLGARVRY